jgi:hypothetical protein
MRKKFHQRGDEALQKFSIRLFFLERKDMVITHACNKNRYSEAELLAPGCSFRVLAIGRVRNRRILRCPTINSRIVKSNE